MFVFQIIKKSKIYVSQKILFWTSVEIFLMTTSLLWRYLLTEHSLHVYYFPHQ